MAVVSVAGWLIVIPVFISPHMGAFVPPPIRWCHPED